MQLLKGRRGPQVRLPRPWKRRTLPGDMGVEVGERYLRFLQELGGLKPDHAVLEPGCGTGRMAMPLTGYLNAEGSYDGFDVVGDAVETCVKEIGSNHPNFRFRHVDVFNGAYNRGGTLDPESFPFPIRTRASTSSSSPRSSPTCAQRRSGTTCARSGGCCDRTVGR